MILMGRCIGCHQKPSSLPNKQKQSQSCLDDIIGNIHKPAKWGGQSEGKSQYATTLQSRKNAKGGCRNKREEMACASACEACHAKEYHKRKRSKKLNPKNIIRNGS